MLGILLFASFLIGRCRFLKAVGKLKPSNSELNPKSSSQGLTSLSEIQSKKNLTKNPRGTEASRLVRHSSLAQIILLILLVFTQMSFASLISNYQERVVPGDINDAVVARQLAYFLVLISVTVNGFYVRVLFRQMTMNGQAYVKQRMLKNNENKKYRFKEQRVDSMKRGETPSEQRQNIPERTPERKDVDEEKSFDTFHQTTSVTISTKHL